MARPTPPAAPLSSPARRTALDPDPADGARSGTAGRAARLERPLRHPRAAPRTSGWTPTGGIVARKLEGEFSSPPPCGRLLARQETFPSGSSAALRLLRVRAPPPPVSGSPSREGRSQALNGDARCRTPP